MSLPMSEIDEIINSSRDAREVKRALSVKMSFGSLPVSQICEFLGVSGPFVSKWRRIYQEQGADGLLLGYEGGQSYLTPKQRAQVLAWIAEQESPQAAQVRAYLEETLGVVYLSQQSYYALMHEAGLSYHKSEKVNPRRAPEQVQERREEIKKNWRKTRKP